jgi:hypothetical protein
VVGKGILRGLGVQGIKSGPGFSFVTVRPYDPAQDEELIRMGFVQRVCQ